MIFSQLYNDYRHIVVGVRGVLSLCFLFIASYPLVTAAADGTSAPEIRVQKVETSRQKEWYFLDATILYDLSHEAIEALHNGVRLNFIIELRVFNQRFSWLRREKANINHRYTLRYHALSRQYSLFNFNTEAIVNYPSLELALTAMGELRQIPLIDSALLNSKREHFLEIRSRLEIESLPLPLRSMAYFTSGWILNSNWSVWALKE